MSYRIRLWLGVAVVVVSISGATAAIVFAGRPGWRINHQDPFSLPGTVISKATKKITLKLPGFFEVVCEKISPSSETGIEDQGSETPVLFIGSFSAEECDKVTNLETTEEEKCEVEGKAIHFNELEAKVVWKETTGSERYLYFNNPLWAKIKLKSIAGKTCPSLLMGMHPIAGQLLAKLQLPTSEQVKKIFTTFETGGSCGKATKFYQGEPRTEHTTEGLTIGGEKGAELCGEFEVELESGDEFSIL